MQDVFVHLVSHRDRLEDRGMSSFLFQLATHVSLNRLRTRRRRPETPDEALLQQIADATQSDERGLAQALLDRLFNREPPSTRVMATLHYVDGASFEDVAEAVGMSVSGVRKRLRTLREKLEPGSERGHD